ncbi:hypothetical protein HWV62_21212 [Athelia sp. TMB]|nr:hypothetical protein HWV62_21212 [Athelia sp. TMB]
MRPRWMPVFNLPHFSTGDFHLDLPSLLRHYPDIARTDLLTKFGGSRLAMSRASGAHRSIGGLSTARALVARDAVNATAFCDSSFSWMTNGKGQSPCTVAAWVQAACSDSGQWNVPPISGSQMYPAPSPSGTLPANACTCWGTWQMNCAQLISGTTYFPSEKGITFPSETAIPYWAAQNRKPLYPLLVPKPTYLPSAAWWPNAEFSATQAQNLAQQGHPDQTGAPSPSAGRSLPIGLIVGGVLGGLAVLLVALALFLWKCSHRSFPTPAHQLPPPAANSGHSATRSKSRPDMAHMRALSDSSIAYLDPTRYVDVTPLQFTPPAPVLPVSPQMTLVTPSGGRRNYPSMIAPTSNAPHSSTYPKPSFLTANLPTAQSSETHLPPSLGSSTSQVQIGFGPLLTTSNTAEVIARRFSRENVAAAATKDPSNAGSSVVPPLSQRARPNAPIYMSQSGSSEMRTMAPHALEVMRQMHTRAGTEARDRSRDKNERVQFARPPHVTSRGILMAPAQHRAQVYDRVAGDTDEEPEI